MSASSFLRNIGIIAHIDAGKTTLAERILFYTNEIHAIGEVDDGSATMDYLPEEQERGITIIASCNSCTWQGCSLNLIDTPGHVDFTIEVERTLRVLDGAVCVICATRGVEPQSETVWRQAEKFKVPKLVFVNKMDRPGADFKQAMQSLRARLQANPLPLQMPVFKNEIFNGVVDLLSMEELVFEKADLGRTVTRLALSDEMLLEALPWREELLEGLADADEQFLERYLSGEDPNRSEIEAAIKRATLGLKITPVFAGSALHNMGVQPVLDGVLAYLPAPEEAHLPKALPLADNTENSAPFVLRSDPKGPLAALIFKVVMEAGHPLALVRLYSGTLCKGDVCVSLNALPLKKYDQSAKAQQTSATQMNGQICENEAEQSELEQDELNQHDQPPVLSSKYKLQPERIGHIFRLHADDKESLTSVKAGDVAAISGLRSPRTGQTLCGHDNPLLLEDISNYNPVISLALEPANSEEGKKLDEIINLFLLEDPTLHFTYDEDSGQRIISGMGELHLEVVLERMERQFKIRPRYGEPRVIYRETILASAQAKVQADRELGGIRHQGSASIAVFPLLRGSGNKVEFAVTALPDLACEVTPDKLQGRSSGDFDHSAPKSGRKGSIFLAQQAAIQAEIENVISATLQGGPLGGYDVTDVLVKVNSFEQKQGAGLGMAVSAALREALQSAQPALLEPIMRLEILAPLEHTGDVLNLLATCGGRVLEIVGNEQQQTIVANAPLQKLFGFATTLRSASQGRAGLTLSFARFDFWQ